MSRCPFAKWRPLPENDTQPRIYPTQMIAHTAVDGHGRTDLWRFFARKDVVAESHFWIYMDGEIEQFMDTNVRADCNRWANSRAISFETEDDGKVQAWTPEQVASIIRLLIWVHEEHKIPVQLCPAWNKPGIGWHSMWGFTDPIAQTGVIDNPWSPYKGKTCPGKPRIQQLIHDVLPAVEFATRPIPLVPAFTGGPMDRIIVNHFVSHLYVVYAGRPADLGGLETHTNYLLADPSQEAVAYIIAQLEADRLAREAGIA